MKKQRIVLVLGYLGTKYQGIQINPNAATLGGILFQILCKVGIVADHNSDDPKKVDMTCASRTDKGVHAAMQAVSIKSELPASESLVHLINDNLPLDIRVLGISRVTRSFQARHSCESRVYEYLFPTFILEHVGFPQSEQCEYTPNVKYRISERERERLGLILREMVGTHWFHNYTLKKDRNDPSARRFIRSFDASAPFLVKSTTLKDTCLEWMVMRIHGSSFMLHQIRKMMGMMILLMKTGANLSLVRHSFGPGKINVPKSPGFGLLLEETCFDGYNRKKDHCGEITHARFGPEIARFKENVYREIYEIEFQNRVFEAWWMGILKHTYELEYMKPFLGDQSCSETGIKETPNL